MSTTLSLTVFFDFWPQWSKVVRTPREPSQDWQLLSRERKKIIFGAKKKLFFCFCVSQKNESKFFSLLLPRLFKKKNWKTISFQFVRQRNTFLRLQLKNVPEHSGALFADVSRLKWTHKDNLVQLLKFSLGLCTVQNLLLSPSRFELTK